jgi:hypothetical protein
MYSHRTAGYVAVDDFFSNHIHSNTVIYGNSIDGQPTDAFPHETFLNYQSGSNNFTVDTLFTLGCHYSTSSTGSLHHYTASWKNWFEEVAPNEVGLKNDNVNITELNHHFYCDGHSATAFPTSFSLSASNYTYSLYNSWNFPIHRIISGTAQNQADYIFIPQWFVCKPGDAVNDLPFNFTTCFDYPNYFTADNREFDENADFYFDDTYHELYAGTNATIDFAVLEYDLTRTDCKDEFLMSDWENTNCDPIDERIKHTEHNQLILQPNPASDVVQIALPASDQGSIAQLKIIDFLGKPIWSSQETILPDESKVITLDTHTWANGIYLVWCMSDKGKTKNSKLVIINH